MDADIRAHTEFAEEFAPLDSSVDGPLAAAFAGYPRFKVAAGIEDSLALLRTAVLLARQRGASLLFVLPGTGLARNGSPNSGVEMHLGTAPCSALIAGILDSVEQRLRKIAGSLSCKFLVELGLLTDSDLFLIRICRIEESPLSSKNQSK